ncbi:MAG: hypothetical protein JXA74_08050, partial [Anaerolineae bacterium]|nr:hypothetical protein [Anaerolineae bacterium]
MRRIMWVCLVIALTVSLASCAPKGVPEANPGTGNSLPLREDYENALPALSQLMLGTLKLEGSDDAVTAAQAKELLPLWRAYRSLSSSDSAASVELEALVKQIGESMTAEQLRAIAGMKLTAQDMRTVMEEQGIQLGARGEIAGQQGQRTTGGGSFPGGFPGGGPMGGGASPDGGFPGGPPGGGEALNAEQVATLRAQRGASGDLIT